MTQATDPEARFLELAARPGMEMLRIHKAHCGYNFEGYGCTCAWEPLPKAKRMEMLVRVAGTCELHEVYNRVLGGANEWEAARPDHSGIARVVNFFRGPTPEEALAASLLAGLRES